MPKRIRGIVHDNMGKTSPGRAESHMMLRSPLMLIPLLVGAPQAGPEACRCAEARVDNGWCGACKVGYVAGVRIESQLLFEALDAHGHDIDPRTVTCPTCQKAMATDGYCETCRIGFHHQQAHFTAISYWLTKGQLTAPDSLVCATCRRNAGVAGWCDTCRKGMIGIRAYLDRSVFDKALASYRRLLTAVETLKRCDLCATALMFDGYCPLCRTTYKDGRKAPVNDQTSEPAHSDE